MSEHDEDQDEIEALHQAADDARYAAGSVVAGAVDAPGDLTIRIIEDNDSTPGWWLHVETERGGDYVVYLSDDHAEAKLYTLDQHMKAAPAADA